MGRKSKKSIEATTLSSKRVADLIRAACVVEPLPPLTTADLKKLDEACHLFRRIVEIREDVVRSQEDYFDRLLLVALDRSSLGHIRALVNEFDDGLVGMGVCWVFGVLQRRKEDPNWFDAHLSEIVDQTAAILISLGIPRDRIQAALLHRSVSDAVESGLGLRKASCLVLREATGLSERKVWALYTKIRDKDPKRDNFLRKFGEPAAKVLEGWGKAAGIPGLVDTTGVKP